MKMKRYLWAIAAMSLVLALMLQGCATTPSGAGKSPRDLLVSSGFKQDVADEPGEIKHFPKVPSEQLLCYQRGDQKCYAYKDPATNSMYIGDEAAFKRYIDRAVTEQLDKKYQTPVLQPDDPQFWPLWVDKYGGG
jgi:hypothetical protein